MCIIVVHKKKGGQRLRCLSARSKMSSMLSTRRLKFFRSWQRVWPLKSGPPILDLVFGDSFYHPFMFMCWCLISRGWCAIPNHTTWRSWRSWRHVVPFKTICNAEPTHDVGGQRCRQQLSPSTTKSCTSKSIRRRNSHNTWAWVEKTSLKNMWNQKKPKLQDMSQIDYMGDTSSALQETKSHLGFAEFNQAAVKTSDSTHLFPMFGHLRFLT